MGIRLVSSQVLFGLTPMYQSIPKPPLAFTARVHGFATKTKALAHEIPPATQATLLEALTGGAFDRLNWHIVGHLTEIFQKSQMPGGLPRGGGMGGFGIDRYITV